MKHAHGTFHDLGNLKVPELGRRRVQVYVPSAPRPTGGWRALYLTDGQNVFGDEGSFAGGWHAHEAVEKLVTKRVHVPLIVAIDNGGTARFDELAAWKEPRFGGGKADAFASWMADSLMPRIVNNFEAVPGPLGAVIGGSSMGGLFALYAHHRRPDAFGGALAMSSSFFWARKKIFDYVRSQPRPWTSRIYLDCGGKEAGGKLATLTTQMAELLASSGYGPDDLKVRIDPRGVHNEGHWRKRLPGALRFMYRKEQHVRATVRRGQAA